MQKGSEQISVVMRWRAWIDGALEWSNSVEGSILEYVSGWCVHGFEYHSQPFLCWHIRSRFTQMTFCFQLFETQIKFSSLHSLY